MFGNKQVQPQRPVQQKVPVQQQVMPRKFNAILFLLKWLIIIGFFFGAYLVLRNLGIIDQVARGVALFQRI